MEELLAPPSLKDFLPVFQDLGFSDINFVLAMEPADVNDMLNAVGQEAMNRGMALKQAHAKNIQWRITQMQTQRTMEQATTMDRAREQHRYHNRHDHHRGNMGGGYNSGRRRDPDERRGGVCSDGWRCLQVHWMCWACVFGFVLALSLFAYVLHYNFRDNSDWGGWKIVEVFMVLGWISAIVTAGMCVCTLMTNPEQQNLSSFDGCNDCCEEVNCECGEMCDGGCGCDECVFCEDTSCDDFCPDGNCCKFQIVRVQ